jgi:hypothetical protein
MVRAVTPELLKLKVLAAGGLVGASGVALFSATMLVIVLYSAYHAA